MNTTIYLKSRPQGEPTPSNYIVENEPESALPADGVRYETLYLSIDPYLRGRMNEGKSYVEPFKVGQPIESGMIGKVIESESAKFVPGDIIVGMGPWSKVGVADGTLVEKLPPGIPPTAMLGVLGMPGLTAYVGLFDVGKAKPGNTVVVSAAAGAVGSLAVQLAKLKGCRTVGIAGGKEKCAYLTEDLGVDAAIDYKHENIFEALKRATPDGIDVYFENVGGEIFSAVLENLADHARIALCGMISEYNAVTPPAGPNLRQLLARRATIQGFIVMDHWERRAAFIDEVGPWVKNGNIKYREDIVEGLENAPDALLRVLQGKNFGKQIVKI